MDDRLRDFIGLHRDRTFWRDVYARFLSAGLLVLVIYVIGAVAGYFPRYGAAIMFATVGVVSLLVSGWAGVAYVRAVRRTRQWRDGVLTIEESVAGEMAPRRARPEDGPYAADLRARARYAPLVWQYAALTIVCGFGVYAFVVPGSG